MYNQVCRCFRSTTVTVKCMASMRLLAMIHEDLNIDSYAWADDGAMRSSVPARVLYFCAPFREQLMEYYSNNKNIGDAEENILTCLADLFTQDKGFEDAKSVVEALKTKGISVIGAAGFCWGAKVVANLAKTDELKAAVMLHPSRVTVEDIKDIKAPVSVLGAEIARALLLNY